MSTPERPSAPRLHNEYGQPLTTEAIAAELEKWGLKTIKARELDRLVSEQVTEYMDREAEGRKDRYVKRLWRNYHIALRSLVAVVVIQIALCILSVWGGDWRFAQTAAWMVAADILGGAVSGYLWSEIPDSAERRYLKVFS